MAQHTIVTFVRTLGDHMVSTLNSLDGGALVVEPIFPSAHEDGGEFRAPTTYCVECKTVYSTEALHTCDDPVEHNHADRWGMCFACSECDHSMKRDCVECGIEVAPGRWPLSMVRDWEAERAEAAFTQRHLERVRLTKRLRTFFDIGLREAYDMAHSMVAAAAQYESRAAEVAD